MKEPVTFNIGELMSMRTALRTQLDTHIKGFNEFEKDNKEEELDEPMFDDKEETLREFRDNWQKKIERTKKLVGKLDSMIDNIVNVEWEVKWMNKYQKYFYREAKKDYKGNFNIKNLPLQKLYKEQKREFKNTDIVILRKIREDVKELRHYEN